MHSAWASEKSSHIFTFRERSGIEVDFIIELEGNHFAIEVKTNENLSSDDLEGLKFYKKKCFFKKNIIYLFGTWEKMKLKGETFGFYPG